MKTIGELLREKRLSKKLSLRKVEEDTKIKSSFIGLIEGNSWKDLPEYAILLGFIKSLSKYLELEESKTVAVFKRDYDLSTKQEINPKPDVDKKLLWSPRLAFWIGTGLVFCILFLYLFIQYRKFVKPPKLEVFFPKENQNVESTVKVAGKADIDSVVTINNQPVFLSPEGEFETEIEITKDTLELIVKAVSRSGKETVISRKIKADF